MRRRAFIGFPGPAFWVQRPSGLRGARVLMSVADDQEGQSRLVAFGNKLEGLGWVEGIADSAPDATPSSGPEPFMALRQVMRTVPIVFVQIGESVESGMVPSLALPDLNTSSGGLATCGSSPPETHWQAALQVNRLLRGTNVSDLPVQVPSEFEVVINLKTATRLGFTIPSALLARAGEVIE